MEKSHINKLLDKRDLLLNKNQDSKEADKIQDEIMSVIKKNFNVYEVDFIIETLTRFGDAPCVVYDDNGLFAISGAGSQPVVFGKQKIEGTISVFVKKTQWKKTIREALKHYLK